MSGMPPPPPAPGGGVSPSHQDAKAQAKAAKAYAKATRPWFKKKRFILGGLLVLVVAISAVSAGGEDGEGDETAAAPTKTEQSAGAEEDESTPDSEADESTDSEDAVEVSKGFGSADATGDVEVIECTTHELLDSPVAKLRITNNSSGRSNYFVTVAFESPDRSQRFGEGMGSSMGLEPGQMTEVEATGFDDVTGDFGCNVIEVQRTAS